MWMAGIRVKENESFESALKRFKKRCEKDGVLSEFRRRQHFEKPSVRRKRKLYAARRKNRQRQMQQQY
jgi:small subunit ribosomal protein S21